MPRDLWTRYRAHHPDVVDPTETACALAVLAGARSVREVGRSVGLGHSATFRHLLRLRERGVVAWEPGATGTLRPAVKVVRYG